VRLWHYPAGLGAKRFPKKDGGRGDLLLPVEVTPMLGRRKGPNRVVG